MADWLETQAFLFGKDNPLVANLVADRLENSGLVKDSDGTWNLLGDAFKICGIRKEHVGEAYPFAVTSDEITLVEPEQMAYIFCLLISLPEQMKPLRTGLDQSFRDLFEEVVAAALQHALPGWAVHGTGWNQIANDEGKRAIVKNVRDWTRSRSHDETVFPDAKDAQVDVAAFREFGDDRNAYPILLGQCATGVTDWRRKSSRPNLDRWTEAVQFSCKPMKLFAVPFALDEKLFREASSESKGLLLDRIRICAGLPQLSAGLGGRIEQWIAGANEKLPLAA